jgi:hypothetical protein
LRSQNRQYKETLKLLESTKAEFNAYKAKAHVALTRNSSTTFEQKVLELEESNNSLELKLT